MQNSRTIAKSKISIHSDKSKLWEKVKYDSLIFEFYGFQQLEIPGLEKSGHFLPPKKIRQRKARSQSTSAKISVCIDPRQLSLLVIEN